MKFLEFENIMKKKGAVSLADIARKLQTTPQAVSNWKARNHIPYHILSKIKEPSDVKLNDKFKDKTSAKNDNLISLQEEKFFSITDLLIILINQLRMIIFIAFLTVFVSFTYVQFIQIPQYSSFATILLPQNKANNLGGFSALASQFGVNLPSQSKADLSSPSLFPELLKSRIFAEKILSKNFFTNEYSDSLSLLAILTHGDSYPEFGSDTLITQAQQALQDMLEFQSSGNFSILKVKTFEPVFARDLAQAVLFELEKLNLFFKNQTVNEKISFIEQRIRSVEKDLIKSESKLKSFNEKNRQISSPALLLEQERLSRDLDIQKNIFLTLKQQLELAKIEAVQESSVVQILDKPQIPLAPNNKNLKLTLLLSAVLGIGFGIMMALIYEYLSLKGRLEKNKIKMARDNFKMKLFDIITDRMFTGFISFFLITGLPFYVGHESKNPIFFGKYSPALMLIIVLYITILTFLAFLFIFGPRLKRKKS